MKKYVVFALATCAVGSIFASGEVLRFRSAVSNINSTSEAVLEVKSAMEKARARMLPPRIIQNLNESEKAEIDSVFGPIDGHYLNNTLPQCFTNYVNFRFPPNDCPTFNALTFKVGRCVFTEMKPTTDEAIIMFGELSRVGWRNVDTFRYWQNWIKTVYFNELKLWFRKHGKPVVEKNGVNPLAPYMEGLMSALNAPRLEGLNQCFATIGVEKAVDLSALKSVSEINQMKEDVLMANIDLNKNKKAAFDLIVCLGVDGYNEMVRQYNGEE